MSDSRPALKKYARCDRKVFRHGERFCGLCAKAVRYEMSRSGYLTPDPEAVPTRAEMLRRINEEFAE